MHRLFPFVAVLFAAFTLITNLHAQPLVSIETVPIGDVGNAADTTWSPPGIGYGAVAYDYNIGKYEVTIGQYTAFLNAVAATNDPFGLYNANMTSDLNIAGISRSGLGIVGNAYNYLAIGSDSRPISYVSWFDAARFSNWLHNGATAAASTETGAYTLNGATSGGGFTKNPGATWFLPSEDEWYKAAYYKGGGTNAGYWIYPTQSDTAPGNTPGGPTNQANYNNGVFSVTQSTSYSGSQNYLTDVGVYTFSAGAYGTFDQGGNVAEWNHKEIDFDRGIRGGSWDTIENFLDAGLRDRGAPEAENANVGFRVATVPEPSTYALLLMTAAGALWMTRRRR